MKKMSYLQLEKEYAEERAAHNSHVTELLLAEELIKQKDLELQQVREQLTMNPKHVELWNGIYGSLSISQIHEAIKLAELNYSDWNEFTQFMQTRYVQ